jgi:alkyl sulfatase BDS1-like metallo-beta-lactamase superfamily hydrolase
VKISDSQLHVTRGEAEQPAATLDTDRPTLAALLYGEHTLDDALRSGGAKIGGETGVIARLLELFPLPAPAGTQ